MMKVYLGLVSWAENFQHAVEYLWQDRWIVAPIILGFGVQTALYIILKKRLFLPVADAEPSGVMTGASGATSTARAISNIHLIKGANL